MKPVPRTVLVTFAAMAGWILGIVCMALQWRPVWDSVQVGFALLGAMIGAGLLVWTYSEARKPLDKP